MLDQKALSGKCYKKAKTKTKIKSCEVLRISNIRLQNKTRNICLTLTIEMLEQGVKYVQS